MPQKKPVIGITKPDNEDFFAYMAIKLALFLAGGIPLKITPKDKNYTSAKIDGLILGGGKDIFPSRYQQIPKDDYKYDQERDEMEVYWAERARDENIPTLGICRGAQLINVACGGSLHASILEVYKDAQYPDGIIHNALFRKEILIKPSSVLYDIIGKKSLMVNSIHKQAIDKLGEGLEINAQEKNGVVQAVSHKDHSFYLGVQFHPEFLIYKNDFIKIFKALVQKSSD